MMTTINVKGTTVPLDTALQRARIAYMTCETDTSCMSTAQLERRKAVVRQFLNLSKIAQMTGMVEEAAL